MPRVLILGGTTEASAIAEALAQDARFSPMLSFAGTTRAPRPPPIPWRVGGFGGIAALADFLRREAFALLLDATHPFAAQMKRHAAAAASLAGVPVLGVLRPGWKATPGDRWTMVADMAEAVRALGAAPRRVLLTIGQKELGGFQAAPWHDYVVRSVDPPDAASLPANAVVIAARGPFRESDELVLLTERRIEVIVTKNSGGTATGAKLAAARRLGLEVVMVARPPPPEMPTVDGGGAALRWLEDHAATPRGV